MRANLENARHIRNHLGTWFAAVYLLLVIAVLAVTATTTQAGNLGLDWIPFWSLALPWSRMSVQMLIPGFLLNALILYLFGWLLQALIRRFIHH